jgi:hypothetical protein
MRLRVPGRAYAESYVYNNTTTSTAINVASEYHFVQGIYTGTSNMRGWTFSAGSNGTGNITTASGGSAININDSLHGLISGNIVNVQSANHTGTVVVTYVDDNNFTVPIAYVGDETGYWQQGDRFIAGSGAAGLYHITLNISLTCDGNGKTYKFEVVHGTTHIDEAAVERKIGTGADIGSMSLTGMLNVSDGEEVALQVENLTDTTNLTVKHSNFTIVRI